MNLKATIISIVSFLIIGLTGVLLYCYWPAIKGTVDDSKYLTAEQGQELYDKGFADGSKSESELTEQVNYYKELIDEYNVQVDTLNNEISLLNSQIENLNVNNQDYKKQITNLQNQKETLENEVENLSVLKTENEQTIISLNNEIKDLENQIAVLEYSNEDKTSEIESLKKQVASLQNVNIQLEKINETNSQTITNLNIQIDSLNIQISDMTSQIQNNSSIVTSLNNRISELEKSVAYYEEYISKLENSEQIVVTFEFDNSIYKVELIKPNTICNIENPISTDYIKFNYWTINNEQIDLSLYTFTTSTKVVANVTYYNKVEFKVDNNVYNNQFVLVNSYSTLPTNPLKDGYEFDGWTLNGVDVVNPLEIEVSEDITYIAKFTKLHNVQFIVNGNEYYITTIRNGNKLVNVNYENTDYEIFNGWTLNGVVVDVTAEPIYSDTIFVADITYKYDVKFMVEDELYNSQVIIQNNYCEVPTNPHIYSKEFIGWSLDGVNVVDVTSVEITKNETFVAIFNELIGLSSSIDVGSSAYFSHVNNGKSYHYSTGKTSDNVFYISELFSLDLETKEVRDLTTLVSSKKLDLNTTFFKDGYLYGFNNTKTKLYKIDLENESSSSVDFRLTGTSYNWYVTDNSTSPATQITNLSSYKTINNIKYNCMLEDGWVLYNISLSSTNYESLILMNLKVNYSTGEHKLFEPRVRNDETILSYSYEFLGKYENWLVFSIKYSDGYKFQVYDCVQGSSYTLDMNYIKNVNLYNYVGFYKSYYENENSKLYFTNNSCVIEFNVDKNNRLSFVNAISSSNSEHYQKAIIFNKMQELNGVNYYFNGQNLMTYNKSTGVSTIVATCNKTITGISVYKNSIILNCDGCCYVYYEDVIELNGSSMFMSSQYTSIVFDYYTSDNKYLVDGVNVIENITPTILVSEEDGRSINQYVIDSKVYVLSNSSISLINCSAMFRQCTSLTTLILNNFATANCVDMNNMFRQTSLTTLDLTNFVTTNVKNMSSMFKLMTNLTSVNLSNFDTSNVDEIGGLFYSCTSLKEVDLSSFDTSNVRMFNDTFAGCTNLEKIFVSDLWSTESCTISSNMFFNCSKLHSDTSNVSYDGTKIDIIMANYETGYLTLKTA